MMLLQMRPDIRELVLVVDRLAYKQATLTDDELDAILYCALELSRAILSYRQTRRPKSKAG